MLGRTRTWQVMNMAPNLGHLCTAKLPGCEYGPPNVSGNQDRWKLSSSHPEPTVGVTSAYVFLLRDESSLIYLSHVPAELSGLVGYSTGTLLYFFVQKI